MVGTVGSECLTLPNRPICVANIAKKRKEKRKRKVLNYVSRIESKIEHRSTEIVYLSKVTVYSPNERLFLVRSENHSSIKGNTDSDEGILSNARCSKRESFLDKDMQTQRQYYLVLVVTVLHALRHFYNVVRLGCASNCSMHHSMHHDVDFNRCCITEISTKRLSKPTKSLLDEFGIDLPFLSIRTHPKP